MNEAEFRRMLADNLIYYRKRCGMTQAGVAARINYSDKSVSKWERADGSPDIYVLKNIADMYGITLSDLVSERVPDTQSEQAAEPAHADPAPRRSPFLIALAVGGVWLIATIAFSILNMLPLPVPRAYLAFIYAIPASFAAMEIFTLLWKLPAIFHLLFSSAILWTTAVCIHLTITFITNIYLLYVIAAVAQLLGIFALGLYWQMLHMPSLRRRQP